MKKILITGLILILVLSVFVACGSGKDNSMKDDITTIMEDMSSDISEFGDELTENGNITSDTNGTTDEGILEEIIPDDEVSDLTGEEATDISGELTTK